MNQKEFDTVVMIGGGSFGTSMGTILSNNFKKVILVVRSKESYQDLKKHKNEKYLPGETLPSNIVPALDFEEVEKEKEGKIQLLISAVPTKALSSTFEKYRKEIQDLLKEGIPFVSLSKGITPDTLEFSDDFFYSAFPKYKDQILFLSGPSFAREIVEAQITLVALAGRSRKMLIECTQMFQTNYFKVFQTYDVKGLLLGGALKNVLAVAGGILEGLGYNHNTRAALITRGIAEMLRFGVVFNARPETFYGLSGMGDLILTVTGELSRNRQFGLEIAKGKTPEQILEETHMVVEGYRTAKAIYHLANKYEIRCRIFNGVYKVLYEDCRPKDVINEIMQISTKFYADVP